MEHNFFPLDEEAQPLQHAMQNGVDYLPEVFFIFTVLLLLALVILRRGIRINFPSLSASFIKEGYTYSTYKGTTNHWPSLLLLDINFVVQFSLAIYLYLKSGVFQSILPIHPIVIISGFAVIYVFFRRITLQLLSYLMDEQLDGNYYQYTFNNSLRIFGFLLIPLHVAYFNGIKLPYAQILFIGVLLLFIWLVVRYLVMAARFRKLKSVYFFLYLCALEIIPLVLLITWGLEELGL